VVPLLLLHAFPVHSGLYRSLLPLLDGEVLAEDLRGFGAAALGADPPDLDRCADDVAAKLDQHGADRVILAGTSMGGYVAMAFARRHRDRLAGIALLDTKAGEDPAPARANRLRIAAAVEQAGLGVVYAEVEPALLGDTTRRLRPEVVAEVHAMVTAADPAAVAWAQRAMAVRPDSLSDLSSLDLPALVLRGDEDVLSTAADSAAMAEALRCDLTTVAGAGHLAAIEQPAAVAAALNELIRRRGSG
jgi:pimeloyl-ACP methyl ester carboxylesterase